jgi:integrase/recombinase XerD
MKSGKPILKLMDEFLANIDITEYSRKKYRSNLQPFIFWLTRNADARNPLRSDILRYKQYLISSKKSPSTIDSYLSPVRQLFVYLEQIGEHDNVAAGIHSPRRYEGYRKDPLSADQVRQLLGSINRNTPQGKRDYAIINLMVRTGMRECEIERADVHDLRTEGDNWVLALQRKRHFEKDSLLGITPKVVNPILEYIKDQGLDNESPMFLNHSYVSNRTRITRIMISKLVKKHLRSIGINDPRISAHSLRHTAATTALLKGVDILAVQAMLGHHRVETTMIYQRALEEKRGREGTAVRGLDDAY